MKSTERLSCKKRVVLDLVLYFTDNAILVQYRLNIYSSSIYSLPWKFLNAKCIYGSIDNFPCRSFLQDNDKRLI